MGGGSVDPLGIFCGRLFLGVWAVQFADNCQRLLWAGRRSQMGPGCLFQTLQTIYSRPPTLRGKDFSLPATLHLAVTLPLPTHTQVQALGGRVVLIGLTGGLPRLLGLGLGLCSPQKYTLTFKGRMPQYSWN